MNPGNSRHGQSEAALNSIAGRPPEVRNYQGHAGTSSPITFNGLQYVERALAQFEDFRIVTESVRAGVPVAVRVQDGEGVTVHTTASSARRLALTGLRRYRAQSAARLW